jgi:type IV pilus assembly protein PilA
MGRDDSGGFWGSKPRGGQGVRIATFVLLLLLCAFALWTAHRVIRIESIRGQAMEGPNLAENLKTAVSTYYTRNHVYPSDNRQAGVPNPNAIAGRFVRRVTIANGVITVIYGNQADPRIAGKKLEFAPKPADGSITWTCGSSAGTNLPMQYRPTWCRP